MDVKASSIPRIVLPLVAAGLLAAACSSSGGGGGSSSSSTPPASPTSSAPAASSPSSGGAVQLVLAGGHLSDGTGRTIYLWMADSGGRSTCDGACASAWPPVTGTVTAGTGVTAGQLSTFARPDGTTQAVYAGHPLYYFAEDTAAGAANGQGSDAFGAQWWEVSGTGAAITTPASSSGPSTDDSGSSGSGGGYGY
jgi:predicted lipoprotein with Yx(FWY)xxD motif